MRIIFGTFFIIVSFLGTIFFSKYSGSAISYPVVWYIFFALIGAVGLFLFRSSFGKAERVMNDFNKSRIGEIKNNAERIELDFDHCEFKSGTYFHEVTDENANSLNLISSGVSYTSTKTERVESSSLIYNHLVSGNTEKYIESFPFDSITLKFYVLNRKITLYVSRFDRTKYFFELEEVKLIFNVVI